MLVVLIGPIVGAAPAAQVDTGAEKKPPEESKLGERLIRRIADGAEDDVMSTVVRLMEESGQRLDLDFDPGADTQVVQREIVDRLDQAILAAAKQRRRGRQRPQQSGDRRSKTAKQDRTKDATGESTEGQTEAESDQAGQRGSVTNVDARPGALRETRRGWGHLPPRERDEVIQGIDDASLERYREWIERYYRALQEADE